MSHRISAVRNKESLELFRLFDWWKPSRIADETGLSLENSKNLAKLRKQFSGLGTSESRALNENQRIILSEFRNSLKSREYKGLQRLLPSKIGGSRFRYIDLFAGIGGISKPFADIGGQCALTCELDEHARRTYQANWKFDPTHCFVPDIKSLTQPLSAGGKDLSGKKQFSSLEENIPDHDVLLAGFPCQPFSLAGVSKKNALNRAHGFECQGQGQLFFDICRILSAKQPPIAVLENVKNLKSHDGGKTFEVIVDTLRSLPASQKLLFGTDPGTQLNGYWIANLAGVSPDPKIIDAARFVPQHRERIVMVCVREDLVRKHNLESKIDLKNLEFPNRRRTLENVLTPNSNVPDKYTITPKLWEYLQGYSEKHRAKGNGFGYGMVERNRTDVTRTLSARYYKDGSEILINQEDIGKQLPRCLTPQECARLMGFTKNRRERFRIPVSDMQGYKQFGNSVVVPVFEAVANMLDPHLDTLSP